MKESLESKFKKVFDDKTWITSGGTSVSGSGSEIETTKVISSSIKQFINLHKVRSVVDVPCGDFNWQHQYLNQNVKYFGFDIVPEVVELAKENAKKNPKLKTDFAVGNVCTDEFPPADLMIVRDCLVHLQQEVALAALRNLANQDVKYVAITSFVNTQENHDHPTLTWRNMNLQLEPFNLPMPIAILVEQCQEADGYFDDKSLFVYRIDQLPVPEAAE